MARRGGSQHGWRDGLLVIAATAMVVVLTAVGSAVMPAVTPPGDAGRTPPSGPMAPTSAPRVVRSAPSTPSAANPATPSRVQERAERQTFLEGSATLARRRLWVRPSQAAPPGQELQMIAASSGRSATPGVDLDR